MPNSILVVEDNADSQNMISKILRFHKLTCDLVSSAEDALDRVSDTQYKALIIDLQLPVMDGWTLLDRLKSNPQTAGLTCVAVTAFHSAEVAVKALDAGFSAYYSKPIDVNAFSDLIKRIAAN